MDLIFVYCTACNSWNKSGLTWMNSLSVFVWMICLPWKCWEESLGTCPNLDVLYLVLVPSIREHFKPDANYINEFILSRWERKVLYAQSKVRQARRQLPQVRVGRAALRGRFLLFFNNGGESTGSHSIVVDPERSTLCLHICGKCRSSSIVGKVT